MSNLVDLNELWADVHTLHFDAQDQLYQMKKEWFYTLKESPNGVLLSKNSFFEALHAERGKIYILHVTRDMDKINQSRTLYPSAGCLVGCIYGTQLYPEDNGKFRMHNLGKHILTKEAGMTGGEPTPLIIEVSFGDCKNQPLLSGINYLRLGTIHHTIYEQLKYLLSPDERTDLEMRVSRKVRASLNFITMCHEVYRGEREVEGRDFIRLLNATIPHIAILGYMYFEAIAEYTMLYSRDELSWNLKKRGELNNTIYKEFLLDIYEKIGRFKLSDFNPSVEDLSKKIDELSASGKTTVTTDDLTRYVTRRVCDMVANYLLNDPHTEPTWLDIAWDYSGFSTVVAPLLGHTIHRELRNFNRYNDFYFYFDQFKALSAWNYWNKMNIALPFNGPIQKGEIGINPAYQDAKYRIFTATVDGDSDELLIIDSERADIEIAPRLIDLRHTAMRSRDHGEIAIKENGR